MKNCSAWLGMTARLPKLKSLLCPDQGCVRLGEEKLTLPLGRRVKQFKDDRSRLDRQQNKLYVNRVAIMNQRSTCHHIIYWAIPQIDAEGVIVSEQHYAVNLAEIDPDDAERIESMLRSATTAEGDPQDPRQQRTAPSITEYRHLFRPFIEVKRRANGLCRFSTVWLPFVYAEYADAQSEPRHHTHPSVVPLAGTG